MPGIQDRQFNNEVHHLMGLKHQNIVQLIGYCDERKESFMMSTRKKIFVLKCKKGCSATSIWQMEALTS